MRLEQLRQFIAVAQKGNFRKASRELGISQPALTRSIQNLEHYFNVPLFDRLTSGVVLTDCGRTLMGWAEEVTASTRDVKRYVDLLSEGSVGSLVIGAGAYFDDFILAIALSRLILKNPKLNIKVVRDTGRNAEEMILNRQIDIFLGMIDRPLKSQDVSVITFDTGPVILFCRKGHPLLKLSDPDLADVMKYPFICPIIPEEIRVKIDRFRYDLIGKDRPLLSIEFDSYCQIRKVVELSDCVGGLPRSSMTQFINGGALEELPVSLPGIEHYTSISYLKGRTLLPVTELIIGELTKIVEERSRDLRPGEPA